MDILTQRNDPGRTGVNNGETSLTPRNVNVNSFGKRFNVALNQGAIYAQPLYVSQLNFGARGTHDVVFVATMNNHVCVVDANNGAVIVLQNIDGKPPVPSKKYFGSAYNDIVGNAPSIGILSTPVIDSAANEMYLVLFTVDQAQADANNVSDSQKTAAFQYVLYAIDLTTLQKKRSAVIGGSVTGTGYSSSKRAPHHAVNGQVSIGTRFKSNDDNVGVKIIDATGIGTLNPRVHFNAFMQLQRPALLLLNGVVYVAFGSRNDVDPWHGWIFAYQGSTLQQLDVLCTTPNGAEGGIWQAGQGLIADSQGNVYAGAGNGDSDQPTAGKPGTPNMGESFFKIKLVGNKLQILGWYNAFDDLNYIPPDDPNPDASPAARDDDLGASAPTLLPDDRVVGGGKDGYFYLIDGDQLIGDAAARQKGSHPNNVVLQYFLASYNFGRGTRPVPTYLGFGLNQDQATHHIHGSPLVWQNGQGSASVYVWGENDVVRAYAYSLRQAGQPLSGGFPSEGVIGSLPLVTADFTVCKPGVGIEKARGMITASNENLHRAGMPGGFLSLSWDGQNASSAILWASFPSYHNGNQQPVSGELIAYDASNFDIQTSFLRMTSLWRSRQNPEDDFGILPKFCCPTIADGKAFQATGDGSLFVYGLKKPDGSATAGGYDLARDGHTALFGGASGLTLNGSANVGTQVQNPSGRIVKPIVLTQNPTGFDNDNPFGFNQQVLIPTFHAGSVFCTNPVDVTNLQTSFTVKLGFINPDFMADGFTFTVQAIGPQALGSPGSGLGYAADPFDQTNTTAQIPRSLALAFNVVNNKLSLWRDGVIGDPNVALITDLGTHGIALNRGNALFVTVSYQNAAKILTVTVRDTVAGNTTGPLQVNNVDIPGFLGLSTPASAFIGFTGGTGARSCQQMILDWSVP